MLRINFLLFLMFLPLLAAPARSQSADPPPTYELTMMRTPFFLAICKGQTTTVRKLLDKGADANTWGVDGENPLDDAVGHGHIEIVRLLIARGANVNIHDMWGFTPLHNAAGSARISLVRLLLERGARADARSTTNDTPLMGAAADGCTEIVRLLIAQGASINVATKPRRMTALLFAVNQGHVSTARFLLEKGADANAKNADGESALDLAKRKKNKAMIALLNRYSVRPFPFSFLHM